MRARIRLIQDIIEPATGDHPDLLLARKGQLGRIDTSHTAPPGFAVRAVIDGHPRAALFLKLDEYEHVPEGT